jgi:hypothetical protein
MALNIASNCSHDMSSFSREAIALKAERKRQQMTKYTIGYNPSKDKAGMKYDRCAMKNVHSAIILNLIILMYKQPKNTSPLYREYLRTVEQLQMCH